MRYAVTSLFTPLCGDLHRHFCDAHADVGDIRLGASAIRVMARLGCRKLARHTLAARHTATDGLTVPWSAFGRDVLTADAAKRTALASQKHKLVARPFQNRTARRQIIGADGTIAMPQSKKF